MSLHRHLDVGARDPSNKPRANLTGVACTHRLVFDLDADHDVYWCAADVGWVTGHSYIVYGPLANAATSVMYSDEPVYYQRPVLRLDPPRSVRLVVAVTLGIRG